MAGEGINTETIMVVEDEEAILDLIKSVLKTQGYDVLTARNGAEALVTAQAHGKAIDLVLTDIIMPGMSGGEMVQQLLLLQPAARVLYMSGYTKYTVNQGILESVNTFIWKPFAPAELLAKIRTVLDAPPTPA